MPKVIITITPHEQYEDEKDPSGVTEQGWEAIHDALLGIAEDINIRSE